MAATAMLNVRLPRELKEQGSRVFTRNGISATEAIRQLYKYVHEEQSLPDWMQPEGGTPAEAKRRALRELAGASKGDIPKDWHDLYIEHLAERHVFVGVRS